MQDLAPSQFTIFITLTLVATVRVNNQEIAYRRIGSGTPMLVINGFAATKDDWDPQFIEALSRGRELIVIDNRGMGESTGPPTDFTTSDLAQDAAAILDALEIQCADVLGWSMGGFVALSLAHLYPQRVEKLILLGTTAGGEAFVPPLPEVHAKLRDLSGSPRQQASQLISLLFTPQRAVTIDSQYGELVATARAALNPDVIHRQIKILDEWELDGFQGSLSEITHPTLAAAGIGDVVFPVMNSINLANAIPGAWLAQFENSGHAFMADHPQSLTELIDTFTLAR